MTDQPQRKRRHCENQFLERFRKGVKELFRKKYAETTH